MYVALRKLIPVIVSLYFTTAVVAQVATAAYPFGTFDSKGFDTINVGNLNVNFSIPVLNKAGRGMPFTYALSYNSSIWYPTTVNGTLVWTPVNLFGWGADTAAATGFVSYTTTRTTIPDPGGPAPPKGGKPPTCAVTTYGDWIYFDPIGTSHAFYGTDQIITGDDSCPQSTPAFTEIAGDGSGYTLATNITGHMAASITSRGGKTVVPAMAGNSSGTVTDTNGNEISVDSSGHFTDTAGNVALTIAGSPSCAYVYLQRYGWKSAVGIDDIQNVLCENGV